ncbi:Pantetheinase-like [Mactra antiquata]
MLPMIYIIYLGPLLVSTSVLAVDTYRAAVYGHNVTFIADRSEIVSRKEALKVMMKNIAVYRQQALKASKMGAKLVVFPEYGLCGVEWNRTTFEPYLEEIVPVTVERWNPCTHPEKVNNTEIQSELSCLARNADIYVVANMGARQPCSPTDPSCPDDGHYQHSANVVYAPNGDFIARYFKYNLYWYENYLDKPKQVDITTFTTPFGRFGTMASNDILFHDPIIQLVHGMNITNIVYPNSWINNLPLYGAIEFHSAFAEGLLINLLSANLQMPSKGYYGSGLYWPSGTSINASYKNDADPRSGGVLVVETMTPFIVTNEDHWSLPSQTTNGITNIHDDDDEDIYIDINGDKYTIKLVFDSYGDIQVCQNTLCCSASYESQMERGDLFVIGAFDGIHNIGERYYLQACIFIKCVGDTKLSCGLPTSKSRINMSKMSFVGNFTTPYVYPEVLTDQDGSLGIVTTVWLYQGSIIIDAGLYGGTIAISMIGRDYSRDP